MSTAADGLDLDQLCADARRRLAASINRSAAQQQHRMKECLGMVEAAPAIHNPDEVDADLPEVLHLGGGNVYFLPTEPMPLPPRDRFLLWSVAIMLPLLTLVGLSFTAGYVYARWIAV